MLCFFFSRYVDHRDLHVLTHSFPTRRSSDLIAALARAGVAHVALGEFGFDEFIAGAFDDFFVETLFEFGVEFGIAVEIARLEKRGADRSEEHTSELQSLMRISYAVFCLKKKKKITIMTYTTNTTSIQQ